MDGTILLTVFTVNSNYLLLSSVKIRSADPCNLRPVRLEFTTVRVLAIAFRPLAALGCAAKKEAL